MGGESREGWIPWIGRQYNDFRSILSSLNPYTPDTTPPPPPIEPQSWKQIGQNLKTKANELYSEFETASKDPVRYNIQHGLDFYKKAFEKYSPLGERVLGRVGAVTTAPMAKMAGALWDIADPRNSGSEQKPLSDVLWEGAKATKKGLMDPTAPQPELARELGKRIGPTALNEMYERDPLGYYGAKFALNSIDPTSLPGGEHLIAGAVGTAAHGLASLAGMGKGAEALKEAAIPVWLYKKQKGVAGFLHGSHSGEDVKSMIASGFIPKTGDDILQRYAHMAPITQKEVDYARKTGTRVSHPISKNFGSYEMPVSLPENAMMMDVTEPVPKEDIELIVSKLHPEHDKQKIERIWRAWEDQAPYVVDPADQISGKVPFSSVTNNPNARLAVKTLENELRYGDVHGIRGLGGDSPLNHPDMPTSTNSPIGAIAYYDTAASNSPESVAFDPRVASVTDLDQKKPWKPLGMYQGYNFPKDYVDPAQRPFPKVGPVQAPTTKQGTKIIKPPTGGSWDPAEIIEDSADMHIADIKSVMEEHGVDPNLFNISEETKKTYSPELLHTKAAEYLDKFGHNDAANAVQELWDTKKQTVLNAQEEAKGFHDEVVSSGMYNAAEQKEAWNSSLSPEAKQEYAKLYPDTYKANVKSTEPLSKDVKAVDDWDVDYDVPEPQSTTSPAYKALQFDYDYGSNPGVPAPEKDKAWAALPYDVQEAYKKHHPEKYKAMQGEIVQHQVPQLFGLPKKEMTAGQAYDTIFPGNTVKDKVAQWAKYPEDVKLALKKEFPAEYDLLEKTATSPTFKAGQKLKVSDALPVDDPLKSTFAKVFGPDSDNSLETKKNVWNSLEDFSKDVYKKHMPDEIAELEASFAGPVESPIKKTPKEWEAEDKLKVEAPDDGWGTIGKEESLAVEPSDVKPASKDMIEILKEDHPELVKKFEAHSGTEMGSIESHTKDVMKQWETQLSDEEYQQIADSFGMPIHHVLGAAFPLHDIGKADAIAAGDKAAQHMHTIPIMRNILQKEGFTDKEITLATELFNHDYLGAAVQGKGKVDLKKVLTEKAQKVGMDPAQFAKLQLAVYQADAASYPFITQFMKKEGNKWTFKGNKYLKGVEELIGSKK